MPLGGSRGYRACADALENLALDLGSQGVAREKRQAIQFGARIAKMEIGKGRKNAHMRLSDPRQWWRRLVSLMSLSKS
jgi:hypothetical protein